jgi:hypothetical protein
MPPKYGTVNPDLLLPKVSSHFRRLPNQSGRRSGLPTRNQSVVFGHISPELVQGNRLASPGGVVPFFRRPLFLCFCLLFALSAGPSARSTVLTGVAIDEQHAVELSYTGTLDYDSQTMYVHFALGSPTTATFRTWSFAGGDSFYGVVNPGGFSPVLSLFDSVDGGLIAMDRGGTVPNCGARNIDPVSGFCLDSYINMALPAGWYELVLTEDDNTPNGNLGTGFLREDAWNFTGPEFGVDGGSLILFDRSQRTSAWNVDLLFSFANSTNVAPFFADTRVESTDPVSQTSEVSSGVLSSLGLAILFFTRSRSLKTNHAACRREIEFDHVRSGRLPS